MTVSYYAFSVIVQTTSNEIARKHPQYVIIVERGAITSKTVGRYRSKVKCSRDIVIMATTGGARNNIQQNTNGQAGFKQNYNGYNQNRWNNNGPYRPQQRDPAASGGQLEGRNSRPQGQYRQQGQFRGNTYQNNGATQQYGNQRNYSNVNAMESFEQEN